MHLCQVPARWICGSAGYTSLRRQTAEPSSGRQPAARSPNPSARAHQGSSRPKGGSPPRSTSRYGGGSQGPGRPPVGRPPTSSPNRSGGGRGWLWVLVILAALGVGAWLARDNIALIISDLQTSTTSPAPTTAPSRSRTVAIPPTATPTVTPTPTPPPVPRPDLRHIEAKRYMLELINAERVKAGVGPVVLGNNIAAQLHAEDALENCYFSHWGLNGLKPYMRYSLAGGYQANAENVSGINYCYGASDNVRGIGLIRAEIRSAMSGLMESQGHRDNILDPGHRKVNIGLAWDLRNVRVVQHFEGDHVQYDVAPVIEDGVLTLSGTVKNGVLLPTLGDLSVQVYHDPPPHQLTSGQVARTYCYDSGRPVASLRLPVIGNSYYPDDEFTSSVSPCPDPYAVPADAVPPQSPGEAHGLWQQSYDASQDRPESTITVRWVTASEWRVKGTSFSVKADLSDVLAVHGPGVYTIFVWGIIGGESAVLSEYSIFHGVTPPDTYASYAPEEFPTNTPTPTPSPAPPRPSPPLRRLSCLKRRLQRLPCLLCQVQQLSRPYRQQQPACQLRLLLRCRPTPRHRAIRQNTGVYSP